MRKQANGSANKVGSDALKSSLFLLSGADKILRPSTFTVFQECKSTGKSLSEALSFASTNPQHDNRFFIKLQVQ